MLVESKCLAFLFWSQLVIASWTTNIRIVPFSGISDSGLASQAMYFQSDVAQRSDVATQIECLEQSMNDYASEVKREMEREFCERRGITLEQLAAQYEALRCWRDSCGADLPALQRMIQNGFDINSDRSNEGGTELMFAARHGKTDAVAFLISIGADVNLRDMYGFTALMWTAVSGNAQCAKHLLEAGADPRIESDQNASGKHTALSLAISEKNFEVQAVLKHFLGDR
jgi:hypothetical protein